jgi:hypothetical protein
MVLGLVMMQAVAVPTPTALAAGYKATLLYQFTPPAGSSMDPSQLPTVEVGGAAAGQVLTSSDFRGLYDAAVWSSAGAPSDLNPSGYFQSVGAATDGVHTVGNAESSATTEYAALWTGTSKTPVDLNPNGFTYSAAVGLSGSQQVGFAEVTAGQPQAYLWTGTANGTNLKPTGFVNSTAVATDGTQQVGNGYTSTSTQIYQALLWSGSATTYLNLNPPSYTESWANGIDGNQQVGDGIVDPNVSGYTDALLWKGSASSVAVLTPQGYFNAQALSTNGSQQVGFATPDNSFDSDALVWSGSAQSMVDLESLLPTGFYESQAQSIDSQGDVFGWATQSGPDSSSYYAVEWTPVPEPTTLALLGVAAAGSLARRRIKRASRLGSTQNGLVRRNHT